MCPITDKLKEHGVRFRWNAASDVVVVREGAQFKAADIAYRWFLLAALNIEASTE